MSGRAWIKRATVGKEGGSVEHVVAQDAATLVYLGAQACITLHPWLSRADRLDRPGGLIFDVDPSDGNRADVHAAARAMVELVRELVAPGARGGLGAGRRLYWAPGEPGRLVGVPF